jgi:tRNA pseudouridine38-40 synthase
LPRYKLTIEYAGTRYSGWQIQKNARTVQGELHQAIQKGLRASRFETYGSGRTDAGVHALAQVAHLDIGEPLPADTLAGRINSELPHDVNVISAERMPPRFHARHSAVARSYIYQIATRRTAFAKPFVWWVREPLALDRMELAASAFAGFRDFRSFTDDDPDEKSTTVELRQIRIARAGDLILLRVVGSHFLWKMVRRLTGVIVEIGKGGLKPEAVMSMLASTTNAEVAARLTAPASGLFLERVFYEPPPDDWPLAPAVAVSGRVS